MRFARLWFLGTTAAGLALMPASGRAWADTTDRPATLPAIQTAATPAKTHLGEVVKGHPQSGWAALSRRSLSAIPSSAANTR